MFTASIGRFWLICMMTLLCGCNSINEIAPRPTEGFKPLPMNKMRFANTIRQQLDFSCGAATVATILTFYFNDRTSEGAVLDVLETLPNVVDWRGKMEAGFSFSDLIYASKKFGYDAQGANIELDQLSKVSGPLIIHLDKDTFQHFVVLRKMGNGVAYISDPIIGSINMPIHELKEQYTGYALAIWKQGTDLPEKSRLEAVRDGTSVSDVTGRSHMIFRPPPHPIL